MAAPYKDYAEQLYDAGGRASNQLGTELRTAEMPVRTLFTVTDLLIGGVLQILVTRGLITEEDIASTFDQIGDSVYPQLPFRVIYDEDHLELPPPDLGD